jgi:catechol 2,3-dioxygenase-like lactoylglutathione lyase family enzyme
MVRDVQRAIRFYKSIGFALRSQDVPNDPKYAVIARDGVELHLQWHDAQEWTYPNDRPTYRFFVRDVDGLHREFRETGQPLDMKDVAETAWGTREFHLRDPDLNGLQFYHPL